MLLQNSRSINNIGIILKQYISINIVEKSYVIHSWCKSCILLPLVKIIFRTSSIAI